MDAQNRIKNIKSLSEDDRPREKMLQKGQQSLSNAELIALLIRSGTAEMNAVQLSQLMLRACNNNIGQFAKLSIDELTKFPGIGPAKAITITAALELGRRKQTASTKAYIISGSRTAFQVLEPHLADLNTEEFWVVFLNRGNRIIRKEMLTKGGISGTVVDKRTILKKALDCQASGIIVAHNHPSGNLKPSNADKLLTQSLKQAADLVEMKLLDHLIISQNGYFSFAQIYVGKLLKIDDGSLEIAMNFHV